MLESNHEYDISFELNLFRVKSNIFQLIYYIMR